MLKMRRLEKPDWRSQRPQVQRAPRKVKETSGSGTWMTAALKLSYFLPGLVVGFVLGLWTELPKDGGKLPISGPAPARSNSKSKKRNSAPASSSAPAASSSSSEELKMVFVVRMDLKMGGGKIASQCAHAAISMYGELLRSNRSLLSKWESQGQPKIVVSCKHEPEMDDLQAKAERAGLPTFTIADAGRTQVAAGSKTVLVIGPGARTSVDSVTRQLRLL